MHLTDAFIQSDSCIDIQECVLSGYHLGVVSCTLPFQMAYFLSSFLSFFLSFFLFDRHRPDTHPCHMLSSAVKFFKKCFSKYQDGREVKALDLRSNGQMSSWVRTPLLVEVLPRTKRKPKQHPIFVMTFHPGQDTHAMLAAVTTGRLDLISNWFQWPMSCSLLQPKKYETNSRHLGSELCI